MNENFAFHLRRALDGRHQNSVAAQMGISPSQLHKALNGAHCERTTVAKIVAGVSDVARERAECMAAYLCDVRDLAGADAHLLQITVRKR